MRYQPGAAVLYLPFLLPSAINAVTLDCAGIRASGVSWDLTKLGGRHSVYKVMDTNPQTGKYNNITFSFDICRPLERTKNQEKNCDHGTRICAEEWVYKDKKDEKRADDDDKKGDDDDKEGDDDKKGDGDKDKDKDKDDDKKGDKDEPELGDVWEIAGEYAAGKSGRHLDPQYTRLKGSSSDEDSKKEGVRIEMHGGMRAQDTENKPQKAIITLYCPEKKKERRDDEEEEKEDDYKLVSYESESDNKLDVLRISWNTKHACEDAINKPDNGKKSAGWGFFTWFIIIFFLGIAAYLIFGSWLNYNRHGARGWDLLPHGDTIRDLPYLLKDWGRQLVSTVQGRGSRDLGYIRV